jgi:hypothetical protein
LLDAPKRFIILLLILLLLLLLQSYLTSLNYNKLIQKLEVTFVVLYLFETFAHFKHETFNACAVASCGWLNIPNAVRQQPISYTVGSQVSILGCMNGFMEYGSSSSYVYMCQSTGYQTAAWTPSIAVSCVCKLTFIAVYLLKPNFAIFLK